MVILPNKTNKMWNQNNRSDILGTMWSSFNLNLTEQLGKVKVSPRLVITTNGIAGLSCPAAFKNLVGNMYAVCTGGVFKCAGGLLETPFAAINETNMPSTDLSSDFSDAEIFQSQLVVSGQYGATYVRTVSGWLPAKNLAKLGDGTTNWTVAHQSSTVLRFTYSSGTDPSIGGTNIVTIGMVMAIQNGGLPGFQASNQIVTGVGSEYFEITIANAATYDGTYVGSIGAAIISKEGVEQQGNQTFHKLLNFYKTNRLYVVDTNNQVDSCDTSFSFNSSGSPYTFKLPNPDLIITSLVQNDQGIFILTMSAFNATGFVFFWDGVTADTATNIIPLDSRGAICGFTIDGTTYIIDVNGRLLRWNGQAFLLMPNGQLPIKLLKYLTFNSNLQAANRWLHPNGITSVNGRINILVNNLNNDNAGTIQEALPSGVWEYDPTIGWYHKNAVTQYDISSASPSISDYGQNRVSRVGALVNNKPFDTSANAVVGTILAGVDYYVNSTTVKSGIFTNDSLDTIQKRGYLVTTKILASAIQDAFAQLYLRIRPLLNPTDRIYLKYRTNEDVATETTITWVNNNTFTTTGAVGAYVAGNEVEILSGTGSGWTPNILSITNNAGTYTVVLDETFPNSNLTGTSKARFQTWKKGGIFSDQKFTIAQFGIAYGTGAYVELKLAFLYTGNNEMIDAVLINNPFQLK